MIYQRQDVFTLTKILNQLVEWIKIHKTLPKAIYLPPEEYIYINYIMTPIDFSKQTIKSVGIPLKVNRKKQEKSFSY